MIQNHIRTILIIPYGVTSIKLSSSCCTSGSFSLAGLDNDQESEFQLGTVNDNLDGGSEYFDLYDNCGYNGLSLGSPGPASPLSPLSLNLSPISKHSVHSPLAPQSNSNIPTGPFQSWGPLELDREALGLGVGVGRRSRAGFNHTNSFLRTCNRRTSSASSSSSSSSWHQGLAGQGAGNLQYYNSTCTMNSPIRALAHNDSHCHFPQNLPQPLILDTSSNDLYIESEATSSPLPNLWNPNPVSYTINRASNGVRVSDYFDSNDHHNNSIGQILNDSADNLSQISPTSSLLSPAVGPGGIRPNRRGTRYAIPNIRGPSEVASQPTVRATTSNSNSNTADISNLTQNINSAHDHNVTSGTGPITPLPKGNKVSAESCYSTPDKLSPPPQLRRRGRRLIHLMNNDIDLNDQNDVSGLFDNIQDGNLSLNATQNLTVVDGSEVLNREQDELRGLRDALGGNEENTRMLRVLLGD